MMISVDNGTAPSDDGDSLRTSEERYRLLAEAADDVIWTMSVDGRITYASPSVEVLRGFTPDEAMDQSFDDSETPASAALSLRYFAGFRAALIAGLDLPADFREEIKYRCKDGSSIVTEVHVIPHFDEDGELIEFIGVSRDISVRKAVDAEILRSRGEAREAWAALALANAQLRRLATVDALTGVANRRHFDEIVTSFVAEAAQTARRAALLFFDIDHFTRVNDVHGHRVGDRLLIEMVDRISRRLRSTDLLGRWGGEEFVMLLRGADIVEGLDVGEDVRQIVEATPFSSAGTVTVSVGVATLRADEPFDRWMARADAAMNRAKVAGRNTVCADDHDVRRDRGAGTS